jgi:diguanylate cyclase (GGDEF)-like protein
MDLGQMLTGALERRARDPIRAVVNRGESKQTAFDPMSGTWTMVFVDVAFTTGIGLGALWLASFVEPGPQRWVAFTSAFAAFLLVAVAIPLRVFLLRQRQEAADREVALRVENERREFDTRVSRALDMAEDELSALALAGRALGETAPGVRGVVLIADSSRAHLKVAARTDDADDQACCDVGTPSACPAVRNGHALRFPDSRVLDACPHLAARSGPLSAVCVPVSIMGRASGVVHAVRGVESPIGPDAIAGLEIVAHHVGTRVGLLRAMSQSQLQANTDPLTGLRNRRSTENEVRALVRASIPFAIALADLDHFKQLNDRHGHDTGDRALRTFAQVLKRTVRDSDIVSRHGGEEFVVVFPKASAVDAAAVFERVRMELALALSDGRTPPFTCSVGVVDTTQGTDIEELLEEADHLLLEAKRQGRDRVLVSAASAGRAGGDTADVEPPVG